MCFCTGAWRLRVCPLVVTPFVLQLTLLLFWVSGADVAAGALSFNKLACCYEMNRKKTNIQKIIFKFRWLIVWNKQNYRLGAEEDRALVNEDGHKGGHLFRCGGFCAQCQGRIQGRSRGRSVCSGNRCPEQARSNADGQIRGWHHIVGRIGHDVQKHAQKMAQ